MSQSPPAKRARLSSDTSNASDLEPQPAGTSSIVQPFPRAISTEDQPPAASPVQNSPPKSAQPETQAVIEERNSTTFPAAGSRRSRSSWIRGPTRVKSSELIRKEKAQAQRNKRFDNSVLKIFRILKRLEKAENAAFAFWIADSKREMDVNAKEALDALAEESDSDSDSSLSSLSSASSTLSPPSAPSIEFNSYISKNIGSLARSDLNDYAEKDLHSGFAAASQKFGLTFQAACDSLRCDERLKVQKTLVEELRTKSLAMEKLKAEAKLKAEQAQKVQLEWEELRDQLTPVGQWLMERRS